MDRPSPTSPATPTPTVSHPVWLRWAALLGFAVFIGLFVLSDVKELWRTTTMADPRWLPLPALCALASYAAMTLSYQGIATAAGVRVPFLEMFKITMVANTVNYLLSSGGLSGFAARMYFLARRGVAAGPAVLISLAQTFLTNVTLMLFVLAGFLYLLRNHNLHGAALIVTVGFLALSIGALVLVALLMLRAGLRRRTLFYLAQAAHWALHRLVPHRTPPRTHIWRYQHNLNRGIQFLLARKREMVLPSLYILLDWVFTLLILHTAFQALHYPIRPSFIVVAFAVAMVCSVVSPIPGGLGIMDGSMAGVLASLGVPFETAVVAVLFFRISYYVLPVAISLFFFHAMFVQSTHLPEADLATAALDPTSHRQEPPPPSA